MSGPVGGTGEHAASAIIVAAGRGERMRSAVAKQFIEIGGIPILARTLRVFARHPRVFQIGLVVLQQDMDFCRRRILPAMEGAPIQLIQGGARRQDSVHRGLAGLAEPGKIVVIHDGVRPFVSPELIAACIDAAAESGACVAAIPASDTLKRVGPDNTVEQTVERDRIWLAQTPQAFDYELVKTAFDRAAADGFAGTDDASIVERTGRRVRVIPGSRYNMKITTPEDLEIAAQLVQCGR